MKWEGGGPGRALLVAAGVILDPDTIPDGIFNSKQVSPKKRLQLR